MSEQSNYEADDTYALRQQALEGTLTDELGARHLGYRRALAEHLQRVTDMLALETATRDPSMDTPAHDPLPRSWQKVREARHLRDAAADAVREYRAHH